MCSVVLTRFDVCLLICFWCYVKLWTEAIPLVITLVSSRLVSFLQSLGTSVDRGSTYLFTVLHRRTILIFFTNLSTPRTSVTLHVLSVTGGSFVICYGMIHIVLRENVTLLLLKRQSWGKTRLNMKKFGKSEPLWNVSYLKAAVDIILLMPTFMVSLYPW